ncbi:hypothetical protein ACN2C7_11045 [Caulobacter sp. ErkDOM-E]|uniref:hypothetical protein n=1 Tax=Caulobacter sp. ErkDOM-E TaxID=3402778 RepID=UPI003AF6E4B0
MTKPKKARAPAPAVDPVAPSTSPVLVTEGAETAAALRAALGDGVAVVVPDQSQATPAGEAWSLENWQLAAAGFVDGYAGPLDETPPFVGVGLSSSEDLTVSFARSDAVETFLLQPATAPGETIYFLTDYSDEGLPCAPTLAAWAGWLATGLAEEGPGREVDGDEEFDALVMTLLPDVIATRTASAWSIEGEVGPGATWFAARSAVGMGWSADTIEDSFERILDAHAPAYAIGDRLVVAVARHDPPVRLAYRLGEERSSFEILGSVQ